MGFKLPTILPFRGMGRGLLHYQRDQKLQIEGTGYTAHYSRASISPPIHQWRGYHAPTHKKPEQTNPARIPPGSTLDTFISYPRANHLRLHPILGELSIPPFHTPNRTITHLKANHLQRMWHPLQDPTNKQPFTISYLPLITKRIPRIRRSTRHSDLPHARISPIQILSIC